MWLNRDWKVRKGGGGGGGEVEDWEAILKFINREI